MLVAVRVRLKRHAFHSASTSRHVPGRTLSFERVRGKIAYDVR